MKRIFSLVVLVVAAFIFTSCEDDFEQKALATFDDIESGSPIAESQVTFTANGVSFEMIYVKGGTFTMGATSEQGSDAYSNEKPTHQVTLSSYYIGKYEVTQKLWKAVMGSNPSNFNGDDNRPVECVTWHECQTFITKLNELTGKCFALPTEAQWEYAARGGNKSKHYKFSGSNTIGNVTWYSSNAQTNPQGPSSGFIRVLRGGSWGNSPRYCRVSCRIFNDPDNWNLNYGLRLVLLP